jgi:hypothetical protein
MGTGGGTAAGDEVSHSPSCSAEVTSAFCRYGYGFSQPVCIYALVQVFVLFFVVGFCVLDVIFFIDILSSYF